MGLPGVKTIFFRSKLEPAGSLALVEYDDGSLGIVRDDQPIEGCRWAPGRLDQSVQAFRDINAQLHIHDISKS